MTEFQHPQFLNRSDLPCLPNLRPALYASYHRLEEGLQRAARQWPDRVFLTFLNRELTFKVVFLAALAISNWLKEKGVLPGERVAICLQNSPQFIITFYAVLLAEGTAVILNPASQANELNRQLEQTDCNFLFIGWEHLQRLAEELAFGSNTLSHVICTTYQEDIGEAASQIIEPTNKILDAIGSKEINFSQKIEGKKIAFTSFEKVLKTNLEESYDFLVGSGIINPYALIIFTSGSSEAPKGCVHSHSSLLHNGVTGKWWSYNGDSCLFGSMPVFHITGLIHIIISTVHEGASCFLTPRWDGEYAFKILQSGKITHWNCNSLMLSDIIKLSNDVSPFDSIKFLRGGGSSMPMHLLELIRSRWGLTYLEGYGLTETAGPCYANHIDCNSFGTVGIPYFDVEGLIEFDDGTISNQPGRIGEVLISSQSLFSHYWRDEEATERAFCWLNGKKFLRTGDLGCFDRNGFLSIIGRIRRVINVGGQKVLPNEVENILLSHSSISEACVVGVIDQRSGEIICAALVVKHEFSGDFKNITDWCKKYLASYKVPQRFLVIPVLPRLSSGKVNWKIIQQEFEANRSILV